MKYIAFLNFNNMSKLFLYLTFLSLSDRECLLFWPQSSLLELHTRGQKKYFYKKQGSQKRFQQGFQWFPTRFLMVSNKVSNGFQQGFQWFPTRFPMVSNKVSNGFPHFFIKVFKRIFPASFQQGFHMVHKQRENRQVSCVSTGFN